MPDRSPSTLADPAHAPTTPGRALWTYRRPFSLEPGQDSQVLIESRMSGLTSRLIVDGEEVARDHTPASGAEAVRNHRLSHALPDGRALDVETGWINWYNAGIAVRVDGALVHESHPGQRIAFPEKMAKMISQQNSAGETAYDPAKLGRNKVPIIVDILCGLLFFAVAKLTDLKTAALVGAAVGLSLVVIQRFVTVDLIGGMMLFGVFMLLISAGFAILFEDEEIIKHRSTVVGLIAATCFLFDGLVLKGRKLGAALDRYMAYTDIDIRRLSIGMGLTGLVMAGGNSLVAWAFSTDVWLFYTTFLDIAVTMALVFATIHWARKGDKAGPVDALSGA